MNKFSLTALSGVILIVGATPYVSAVESASDMQTSPVREAEYALIYNGPVSDAESSEAIADVAVQAGLTVRYITDLEALPDMLSGAKVFIIGGTEDDVEPLVDAFTPDLSASLKAYLNNGGRYLGICGGAYVASVGWAEENRFVDALGIAPAESDNYDSDFAPKIYPVTWSGEERQMYYQAGPAFKLTQSKEQVRNIAYFENQQIAALISSYGKGKVAVSGPHPEAPESWKENALDGTEMESNLDLAIKLMQELLSDRPVGGSGGV
ncbi:BPL-N domain-containing protein [Hahella sp. NBU794]|uniref:BPL-N domain-containing protein n=1 Tax=Hahella sp. NBU794 TaxID=3422590 RepID=UPI003D6FE804